MVYQLLKDLFFGERAYLTYWYAFLISFPYTWRKVLIPSLSGGNFNEFMDLSLYIGDILILSSFICILRHKTLSKSICSWTNKAFHVEQLWLGLFFGYLMVSTLVSSSLVLSLDALWSIGRVCIISLVFYFVLSDGMQTRSTWNSAAISMEIIVFGLVSQSALAILQFVLNGSVGLRLLGESVLSTSIPGVAEVQIFDGLNIRSYGTFLHPNVLAGYLVTMTVLVLGYIYRFHVEQFQGFVSKFHVKQFSAFLIIATILIALTFSYSKSSLFAGVVALAIVMFHVEQSNKLGKFHVEKLVVAICIAISVWILITQGLSGIYQSYVERMNLQDHYLELFLDKPLLGIGIGNSVLMLNNNVVLESWQLQPIHNVYLLMLLELGLVSFGLSACVVWMWIRKVPRGTNVVYLLPLFVIGVISMFDHYPFTIYAGNVLVALALGWLIYGTTLDKIQVTLHSDV